MPYIIFVSLVCVHLLVTSFKVFLWIFGSDRNLASEFPSHAWANEITVNKSARDETKERK